LRTRHHSHPSHLQTPTGIMANYFKQVLGYKPTEQPEDAMEKGRIALSSPAIEALQPGVAEMPVVVGWSAAVPSFSFKGPSPTSKDRYTTPPPRNTSPLFSTSPSTRRDMEVDDGPHGLRRPSEEPATPGNKVRVVESNSPLGHSVSLVIFFLVLY
jgi:hypothetical protein